jgi:hypothetical protein
MTIVVKDHTQKINPNKWINALIPIEKYSFRLQVVND